MCNKLFSLVLKDLLILRGRRRFFRAKEGISRTREGRKGEETPSTLRVFLSRGLHASTRYHSESKVGSTCSVAWVVTSSKPLIRPGSEGLDPLD